MQDFEDEKYRRRLRRIGIGYSIMALLIIPVYTVLYACRGDLLEENMSAIGATAEGYRGLVLWGVISALFYLGFALYLFMLTRFDNGRVRRMLLAGCGMLMATVLLPFAPEVWPQAAQLHNFFAMAAPVVMMLTLYGFVFYLARYDRQVYTRALITLNLLVFLSAVLLLATGTSGLLEVVVTVGMCGYMFMLLVWLGHSEKVDGVGALRDAELRYRARRKNNLKSKLK